MKFLLILLLLICCSFECYSKSFAFGSCLHQKKSQEILNSIYKKKPDKIIFLGDNVYGDTNDGVQNLKEAYGILRENLNDFKNHQFLSIWDDHDYGLNDGGDSFVYKKESKELFLKFWNIPSTDPRWIRDGIYFDYEEVIKGNKVHFIFLDTRYNRSKLKKDYINPKKKYISDFDESKTFLGDSQWLWLEKAIKKKVDLRFIVSSIQIIPEDHGFEKWSNFPNEKNKLFRLIKNHNNTYFLSGDRHISSIYKEDFGGSVFFEFTSSGLNMAWKDNNEKDSKQIIKTINTNNFGLIEFSKESFKISYFNEEGKVISENYFYIE